MQQTKKQIHTHAHAHERAQSIRYICVIVSVFAFVRVKSGRLVVMNGMRICAIHIFGGSSTQTLDCVKYSHTYSYMGHFGRTARINNKCMCDFMTFDNSTFAKERQSVYVCHCFCTVLSLAFFEIAKWLK